MSTPTEDPTPEQPESKMLHYTCRTEGCPSANQPIPISSTFEIDGEIFPRGDVICGVCGVIITDIQPVTNDDDESSSDPVEGSESA